MWFVVGGVVPRRKLRRPQFCAPRVFVRDFWEEGAQALVNEMFKGACVPVNGGGVAHPVCAHEAIAGVGF